MPVVPVPPVVEFPDDIPVEDVPDDEAPMDDPPMEPEEELEPAEEPPVPAPPAPPPPPSDVLNRAATAEGTTGNGHWRDALVS